LEACDQDGGNVLSRSQQVIMKLKSGHPGHPHVRDHTRSVVDATGFQEFIGICESLGGEARRIQEIYRTFPHRRIIVDDRDYKIRHLGLQFENGG
jgi:hypothetical protein